ncbi:MAG: sensor histidine kinase, partial [Acidimicrobiia bacterium]
VGPGRHRHPPVPVIAKPEELALRKTALRAEPLDHVERLAASWSLLADLCFSDLLLLAPVTGERGRRFVVLAQVRPTTGQTVYPTDMVGILVDEKERPLVSQAFRTGEIVDGDATALGSAERSRVQCIPVRHEGEIVAVVTRDLNPGSGRRAGHLERLYLEVFDRLARMVAAGSFPFVRDETEVEEAPRVGDGAILLDREKRIRFASPNAVSALHRMGIHAYADGMRLREIGFDEVGVVAAFEARVPITEELERGDTSVLLRAIPLLEDGRPEGALVLVRDVSDLRRRDRMLVSKDATIREIHHRVKNNLQTIASLLRLQRRRLESPEAALAVAESEQRIRSIGIVHEILAREPGEMVPFLDVVRPLVRMVEETFVSPETRLGFELTGDPGEIRGAVATPLAVVLNELVQNAVDHAFPRRGDEVVEGRVCISFVRGGSQLVVDVVDDGVGLPPGFSLERSKGLGLTIVDALVTSELAGTLALEDGNGTRARLRVPLERTAPVDL